MFYMMIEAYPVKYTHLIYSHYRVHYLFKYSQFKTLYVQILSV